MSTKNQKKSTRTTGYRVESESYPSGTGCYYGQELDEDYIDACTTTKIVGEYDTLKDAKQAAIEERDNTCEFDDWAEEYYGNAGPPFFSSEGENYDDDETIHIYIVDIAKEIAKKAKENAEKENAIQKARKSKPPPKKKAKTSSGIRKFGPQKGNFKPDMEIFLRNPCRVAGGEAHMPTDYTTRGTGKASFVYLIQRLSDRNYTMRSLCLENSGACYTSFSLPSYVRRSIAWLPDTNLDDHSSNDTILDTFHTDLFHPKTGKHALTAESLLAATTSNIECLFLTNFASESYNQNKMSKVIVEVIQTCSSNLKCITLNLSSMSVEILEALAKCKNLRGILFQDNNHGGLADNVLDKGLAQVLSSCQHLKWIYVESFPFHGECWSTLANGACPELDVLWIDCPVSSDDRMLCTAGDHNTIRRVFMDRSLGLCMINPDEKLKSSYIPAEGGRKAWDRLTGKKKPKMPSFEDFCAELDNYNDDYDY